MRKSTFLILMTALLVSCSNESKEEVIQLDEKIEDSGLSALDFNNEIMVSQSMIHTKIVTIWESEFDSLTGQKALDDLSFSLGIYREKIEDINCTRYHALAFKDAVKDYYEFVDDNQSIIKAFAMYSVNESAMSQEKKSELTKLSDQFIEGYNVKMDSITSRQEIFAGHNKVNLK